MLSSRSIALGLVRRDSLFLALSKRYNYPVLNLGVDEGRFSRELVVGYQPFSTAAESFRSVRSALATGPLSQGKNAFAVIGPHARVGSHISPPIWRFRSRKWPFPRFLSTPT